MKEQIDDTDELIKTLGAMVISDTEISDSNTARILIVMLGNQKKIMEALMKQQKLLEKLNDDDAINLFETGPR